MDDILKIFISFGPYAIAIAAVFEAIFLPVPMEVISIPIHLSNHSKAIPYSLTLILFSTLGSAAGYFIGRRIGKPMFYLPAHLV